VEKEKKLQLAAIERMKDDPAEYAMLQSDLLTFAGSAYAHAPLGLPETLSKLSAADVKAWHRRHLLRSPATWFAVGDFDPMELKNLLDRKLPPEKVRGIFSPPQKQKGSLKSKTLRVENKSRQSHIVLGLPAPSFRSSEFFSFRVLNTLLNGMGGRLFNELREKRSLAYSVFASHDAGTLGGVYQIYVGCAPAKVDQAQKELLRVLNSFVKGEITESEFKRAKTYMVGLYQVGFQSNHAQLGSYMRYESDGRGAALVEKFPNLIQKVSLSQVRAVARKYLNSAQKTWVVLGPSKEN
jgi:zinc protease